MNSYHLLPSAQQDLFDIWAYISSDNEDAALRVENAVYRACEFLADNPKAGHAWLKYRRPELLFWTIPEYPSYTIIYRPDTSPLQILAVAHARQSFRQVLRERR